MTHPNDRPHNHNNGRFEPTQATADRAAQAARLKAEHPDWSYQRIAEEAGYSNKGDAWRAIQRCRQAVLQQAGKELIATEAALLDDLFVNAMEVLERDHVLVSHGSVVYDKTTGTALLDDGPKLSAIREMRQIRESYRKLLGLDAPSRVSVDAEKLGQEISKLLDAAMEPEDTGDDNDT